ncbi:translation initiation factor eIF-2B epsilon subunit, GEF [Polyrhizophydium stewartii]|uniref:Translation initiation factor eIF-2B epsilon subunit, GEF n=1 Tax=Polyrhizophydium stewartii TaxID=2732419 RepID=A0ABR4MWP0_9FUNG
MKEVLLERDARFVVEKCLNERLRKMELEIEFRDNEIVRLHDRQRRFDALDIDLDRPDDDGSVPPVPSAITATTTAAASAIASSELSPDDIEFEHAASDHGSHADADADSDADSDASPVHPPDSHDHDDHVVDQDGSNDNNNEIKPIWAHAGFRHRDPAAVAASSASHKHDDEDFGYGSEESASATVSPPRSFAEHAPEQIFQALLANIQPSMLHVNIDDLATMLATPAHDCLTAILDALVRICDLRDLWRSTDKLSAFLRRYSTVVSCFIDDEDDQLFALFALERLCVSFPARLPFFAKLVMVLFQLELVESDAVVARHNSRAPSKDPLDVHSQTRAFVQWLKEHDDYDNKDKDIDPEDSGLSINGLGAELLVPRLFIDNSVDCVRTDSHSSSGSCKQVTFAT